MTSRFIPGTALGAALIATALLATPALAHTGTHLHPHGDETPWGLVLLAGLALAAVAGVLALRAR